MPAAAVSLVAFNRGIRKLRQSKVISTAQRRALTIMDLDLLRSVAGTANRS